MKKLLFSLFMLALPFLVHAQMPFNNDKIESYKIAWITQKLDLSTEDAKIFWPIYNSYVKEQANLRMERKKMISSRKITEINDLSDTEVLGLITNELDFKQKDVNIEKKYYARFSKALPIKTVGKFYRAQETFKKELLDKFRAPGRKM